MRNCHCFKERALLWEATLLLALASDLSFDLLYFCAYSISHNTRGEHPSQMKTLTVAGVSPASQLGCPRAHMLHHVASCCNETVQFQVGSIVVSDVFRFSRSKRAVVSQVMLPRTLSIVAYMIVGVIVARACGSEDVINIMNKSVGIGAVVIVVAGEMVINCTNLYFSGLAIVAFFDTCGCHIPRPLVTIACGIIGSAAGAMGILKRFINFLEVLAVAFPPVAGIMCCEYFVVKAFRVNFDDPSDLVVVMPFYVCFQHWT